MSKAKKWTLIIAGIIAGLFVLFFAFKGIESSFNFNFVKWFPGWFNANFWILLIIVLIIILAGLIIGGYFAWKKVTAFFNEAVQRQVAQATGNPHIVKPKNKSKKPDSEQAAEVMPGSEKGKPDDKIGEEADLKGGGVPPAPPMEKGGENPKPPQEENPKPEPTQEKGNEGIATKEGQQGILDEVKNVRKENKRIFWSGLVTIALLLLLMFGFAFATCKSHQQNKSYEAEVKRLEGLMKTCVNTNAFSEALIKQRDLMIKFGIPVKKEFDPLEVRTWNVDEKFTSLYCDFRAKQPDVDKDYQTLLLKFTQAPKCTCNISPCPGQTAPQNPGSPPTGEEKPQYTCGNRECEKDKGENTDNCETDCPKVVKAICGNGKIEQGETCDDGPSNGTYDHCNKECTGLGPRCGDNKCNNGEDEKSCRPDCYKEPPKPFCGDGICQSNESYIDCPDCEDNTPIKPMDVYPGCDNQ